MLSVIFIHFCVPEGESEDFEEEEEEDEEDVVAEDDDDDDDSGDDEVSLGLFPNVSVSKLINLKALNFSHKFDFYTF